MGLGNLTEGERLALRTRQRELYANRTEEQKKRKRDKKRAWYLENRESQIEAAKEQYRNDREKVKARSKAWRENNLEKARSSARISQKARRKKLGEVYRAQARTQNRKFRVENPERQMLICARSRAKRRGIPFDLELSDIYIPELCPVFGIPLQPNEGGVRGPQDNSPTLDRVIPKKGYVKGNVRVISFLANKLKGAYSLEVFEAMVRYIREGMATLEDA